MVRELTREEKEEYDRLIKGAVQIKLEFEVNMVVQKPDIGKCSAIIKTENVK